MTSRYMYRKFLRHAKEFPSSNLREFAKRRIREDFRTIQHIHPYEVDERMDMIKRCVLVQTLGEKYHKK